MDEVLPKIAQELTSADGNIAAIAGTGISNEDAWELRQLVEGLGGSQLGAWTTHAGLEFVEQVGVGKGTNLKEMGKGDAVLVIASDLEEEVPIWRLRVKQAQDRGAYLVVANARPTRMEEFATDGTRRGLVVNGDSIRYANRRSRTNDGKS